MDRFFDALGLGYIILLAIIPELLAKKVLKSLFDWTILGLYVLLLSVAFILWYSAHSPDEKEYINWIFAPLSFLTFLVVFLKSRR